MRTWLTPKRVIRLSLAAVFVFLVVDGLGARPAYEVHTPGAVPLKAVDVNADVPYAPYPYPASTSISELRCKLVAARALYPNTPCIPELASRFLADVAQAPNTLYIIWFGCVDWHAGGDRTWQGFNVEFQPSDRKLIIHCFVAEPWLSLNHTVAGMAPSHRLRLLLVPTDSMGPGAIQIVNDDRLEHLVGDQSLESTFGTATIS